MKPPVTARIRAAAAAARIAFIRGLRRSDALLASELEALASKADPDLARAIHSRLIRAGAPDTPWDDALAAYHAAWTLARFAAAPQARPDYVPFLKTVATILETRALVEGRQASLNDPAAAASR